MELHITMTLDNAAFESEAEFEVFDGAAVISAVGQAVDRLRRGANETPVIDLNGNQVGTARASRR